MHSPYIAWSVAFSFGVQCGGMYFAALLKSYVEPDEQLDTSGLPQDQRRDPACHLQRHRDDLEGKGDASSSVVGKLISAEPRLCNVGPVPF